ncbi:MAG: hypothetical protein KDK99_17125 [Verrucomicrobiales bacterium]|nr:hypothetical protein [Verrucomicrobiales bacterium]
MKLWPRAAVLVGLMLIQCSKPESPPQQQAVSTEDSPLLQQLSNHRTVTGEHWAKTLQKMGEEPLPVGEGVKAARFAFLPTFDDAWVFQVDFSDAEVKLWVNCENSSRGTAVRVVEDPGAMVAQFHAVEAQRLEPERPGGLDGDYWMLETSLNGAYHATDRWCPDTSNTEKRGLTALVAFCETLIKQSGFAGEITCWGYYRFKHLTADAAH